MKDWIKLHLDKDMQEMLRAKDTGIEQEFERDGEEGSLEERIRNP